MTAPKQKVARALITKAFVERKITEEEGVIEVAVASSEIIDRYEEVVDCDSWNFKNFDKNPVFLWGHNVQEYKPPIGKIEKHWFEGEGKKKKLMFRARFDMEDEFARSIARKYENGFLNAFSVGFQALDWEFDKKDILHYTKSDLLEISSVAVPANPEALQKMQNEGMAVKTWDDVCVTQKLQEKNKLLSEENKGLEEKLDNVLSELKNLREEVKPKKVDLTGTKVTGKQLQDILRILNQATSIALKQIRENK